MALLVLVITLATSGYLNGIVTIEHYYIMGKWMLAFCVSGPTSVLASTCSSGMQTSGGDPIFPDANTQSWWALSMILVIGRFFVPFGFAVAID